MAIVRKAVVEGGETVGVILFNTNDPIAAPPGQTFVDEAGAPPWRVDTRGVAVAAVAADLRSKARQALTTNSTFLALASPTQAQAVAQVQRLTREVNALIRMVLGGDLLLDNPDT